jgi:hypothetical protein
VTKAATGDYTVNLTAGAVADAFYSISGLGNVGSNGTRAAFLCLTTNAPTVNSFRVLGYPSGDGTGTTADLTYVCLQVFGN